MTENVWDELWNKPAFKFLSYSPDELEPVPGIISVNKDWLHEVKAEGDRLQREGLEHHAIAVSYYEKLEAVKELNREYDARPIYELDLVQFHNFRAKLWKILEVPQ